MNYSAKIGHSRFFFWVQTNAIDYGACKAAQHWFYLDILFGDFSKPLTLGFTFLQLIQPKPLYI